MLGESYRHFTIGLYPVFHRQAFIEISTSLTRFFLGLSPGLPLARAFHIPLTFRFLPSTPFGGLVVEFVTRLGAVAGSSVRTINEGNGCLTHRKTCTRLRRDGLRTKARIHDTT